MLNPYTAFLAKMVVHAFRLYFTLRFFLDGEAATAFASYAREDIIDVWPFVRADNLGRPKVSCR